MKRPHPVAGMFVATLALWVLSVICGLAAAAMIAVEPMSGQLPPPAILGAAAAIGSGLFALWTGWRACKALDFLVATTR